MRRRELNRILAARDLVIVKREFLAQLEPGIVGKVRDGAMVGVVVDRPVGEENVGLLGLDDLAERLVVPGINDRPAVLLASLERSGLENLAGVSGLGHPVPACVFGLVGRPLAVVQVKENDLVAQLGVTGHGPSAAVFGVAGVAAADDHFELAPCELGSSARLLDTRRGQPGAARRVRRDR